MVTPPTTPRHAVCTVIYNITCSFFMFTFCGYLYIFIRTSSYKQKHNNILILFGEDPWQRIKKIIEPTKKYLETLWGVPLGENQKKQQKKPKNKQQKTKKTKKTKPKKPKKPNPLEILQSPWLCFFVFLVCLVFCFGAGLSIYIYIHTPPMDDLRCQYPFFESGRLWERAVS